MSQPPRTKQHEEDGMGSGLTVVGIGGGGCNTVSDLCELGVDGATLVAVNTDEVALARNLCPHRVVVTDPFDADSAMAPYFDDTRLVVLTSGFGGRSGTTYTPVIARAAKDRDLPVVGLIFTSFTFEGRVRKATAQEGLATLRGIVDWAAELPCSELAQTVTEETWSIAKIFRTVSEDIQRWLGTLGPLLATGTVDPAAAKDALLSSSLHRRVRFPLDH